ncbi:MAG: SPFH domain-containing protein [Myxococcota bacterium]
METVLIVLVIFAVVIVFKGVKIVDQSQTKVIERLGKFHTVLQPGLNFIIPFLDSIRTFRLEGRFYNYVDMREQVMDFPPQPVITRDNVTMRVDSVIYYQITDPVKAIYEIADLTLAIKQLAVTNLRNIMGELELDDTLASRETVNAKLRTALDDATDKWGIKVNRVELKNIDPPVEIEEAMRQQMTAERLRRAKVTEAEGSKRAKILEAEGLRESEIAKAEGEKRARILKAEGEAEYIMKVNTAQAEAIKMVYNAIHEGRPTNDLIAIKYLEALEKIADGKGNKVFIPYEATGVMGSIGGIKELLAEGVRGTP